MPTGGVKFKCSLSNSLLRPRHSADYLKKGGGGKGGGGKGGGGKGGGGKGGGGQQPTQRVEQVLVRTVTAQGRFAWQQPALTGPGRQQQAPADTALHAPLAPWTDGMRAFKDGFMAEVRALLAHAPNTQELAVCGAAASRVARDAVGRGVIRTGRLSSWSVICWGLP